MRVLSHITLKSKIHLLNYSDGIWYTARHPHITEKYWSYGLRLCNPLQKNPAGAPGYINEDTKLARVAHSLIAVFMTGSRYTFQC